MPLDKGVKDFWIAHQKRSDVPVNAIGGKIDPRDVVTLRVWRQEGIDRFLPTYQSAGTSHESPRQPEAIQPSAPNHERRVQTSILLMGEKQAEPLVTDVLDLHKVPARDVKAVVEKYLLDALKMGYKTVRINHDRGIGAHREIVRAVLARTSSVLESHDAPREDGGWSASIVTLK